MVRLLSVLILVFSAMQALAGADDGLTKKPITTDKGTVGKLLTKWWDEGTAAGNVGDFYDNRDGEHSPLDLRPWPQLQKVKYTDDDFKARRNWALMTWTRDHVTFGNSSTSAPAHLGGSNPRTAYTSARGLDMLYKQYRGNNLYIYPEHRDHDPGPPRRMGENKKQSDHDPGHNGKNDGFGDMYPTNTPYLMISQGSSGSDQPFMRMLPFVLASFRPEVKKKLTESGLLMPTIQMLWRSTNKHLKDPKEYLTGKAHPTVFEGSWVDELELVQKAHALELKSLPPQVQLRVIEEDKATSGVDYFELGGSEVLANTPCCIARIHRSKALTRRLVVSAAASYDVNKSPLTYIWVVLRGDPEKIKIVPKKDDPAVAEITVAYHERRPVAPGSPLESNRIDIGVFVHNGAYYSAPAFITVHTLDREARTYDGEGKILEIAHGMGETDLRVANWEKLLKHVRVDPLAPQLLQVDDKQKAAFTDLTALHDQLREVVGQKEQKVNELTAQLKAAGKSPELQKNLDAARQEVVKAQKAINELLDRKVEALADSPRHFVEARLAKLAQDPLFVQKQQNWLKERRAAATEPRIKALWQKPVRWGLAQADETLTPLRPSKTLADAHWTKFELAQLEALHAGLLAELAFPGMLQTSYQVNFVDQRLSVPREWRDLYHYDAQGACIGWTRHSADGKQEFNYEGFLIIEKDAQGRCVKGRAVHYVQEPSKGKGFNTNPLRATQGAVMVRYEFDGAHDRRGHRAGIEPVLDKKK